MCGNDWGNLSKSKVLGPNLINVESVRQDPGIYIFSNHSDDAWKRLGGRVCSGRGGGGDAGLARSWQEALDSVPDICLWCSWPWLYSFPVALPQASPPLCRLPLSSTSPQRFSEGSTSSGSTFSILEKYFRVEHGEGNGDLLQYSCLGNPMDEGAWWATVHGVASVRYDWVTKQWQREEHDHLEERPK